MRVPDWLPALINAGRAFVTIGAVILFWIVTGWPSGTGAITFAAVTVILFSPRADQAYAAAVGFAVGNLLAAVFAAIIAFAVLPGLGTESFAAFAIALGLYLVPAGALMVQPWQTVAFGAMTMNFVAILAPANPMNFDTVQFYNAASAIVVGSGVAAFSFRLLPPLSPAYRTGRLLALTLRDLRRLAAGRVPPDWQGRVHGRLSVLPDEAAPLRRAQLLAALSVGSEIIKLRRLMHRLELDAALGPAFAPIAQGDSTTAIARLARLDAALAVRVGATLEAQHLVRARSSVLALSELLTQHAPYFGAGAPR